MLDVLAGVVVVLAGRPAGIGLLHVGEAGGDGPFDLGLGEPGLADPPELHQQRLEGVEQGCRLGLSDETGRGDAAGQRCGAGAGVEERRVTAGDVVREAFVDDRRREVDADRPPIVAGGHDRAARPGQHELDERAGQLGVGEDPIGERLGVVDLVGGHRTRIGRVLEVAEATRDVGLDRIDIDVAHHDHRHDVRPVPVLVEAAQRLVGHRLDGLDLADRRAPLETGAGGQQLPVHVEDAAAETLVSLSPLLEHHADLGLDLDRVDGRLRRPLPQHAHGAVEQFTVVGRHRQLVHGLVVGGVGVDVGPELAAERLEDADELVGRVGRGAVEQHVLEEVGHTRLILVFGRRPGVHCEPQLGPAAWRGVAADEVGEPVVEDAGADLVVERQDLVVAGEGRHLDVGREAGRSRRRHHGGRRRGFGLGGG